MQVSPEHVSNNYSWLGAVPVMKTCCSDLNELLVPRFFKALGDPTRVAVLATLTEGGCSCTVSQVAGCLPVDLSVVSRHLRVLREAGIVTAERVGKEVHYRVSYGALVRTLRQIADAIESCCPDGKPVGPGCRCDP